MTRILIVEDDERSRDVLSRRLARRGFEVTVAIDGPEAVAKARSDRPDLILMDVSLPGFDGLEATRQIRGASETASVPIIALTAHAMQSDRDRALAAGCDDFDTKPTDLPRLLEKIDSALGKTS